LATLYTDTPEKFDYAQQALEGSWEIGTTAAQPTPLVIDRIGL
jgi:thymidine phosphorylase